MYGSSTGTYHQTHHWLPVSTISIADNPNGVLPGDMFPVEYNMSIINAQHGSWDRNPPLGYRLAVLNLGEDGLAQNYSILADGWLQPNNTAWGGSLL